MFALLCAWGIVPLAFAQDSKIMVGVSGRMVGPACTNCSALWGPAFSGGYAFTEKIVATFDVGFYSKSESSDKINSFAIGVSGDYYIKEAFKGFYIGPDITFITVKEEFDGTEIFSEENISIGINLGWAIAAGDRFRIIPHFGYGTWFENSDGKITAGLKLGFKL
jgi:hypothetical protein